MEVQLNGSGKRITLESLHQMVEALLVKKRADERRTVRRRDGGGGVKMPFLMQFFSGGSSLATLVFLWAFVRRLGGAQVESLLSRQIKKLINFFLNPYVQITIPDCTGDFARRNDVYTAVQVYLAADSFTHRATRLKAELTKGSCKPVQSVDIDEEITDSFRGATVWWSLLKSGDKRRSYRLTFHRRHRELVVGAYLDHVLEQGKTVGVGERRRLYTNTGTGRGPWSHVPFRHPATFAKLAMDPAKKQEIMDDLAAFKEGKEYYERIGKAWKRGYLLYGPPGTGKSSMIAAMANFLNYDVYDLELTAVESNTELRRLLIETTGRSIVVMEDIDCSLNLTVERKHKERQNDDEDDDEDDYKDNGDRVTLSGLLNFIDGLWSASSGERLVVMTTNHVERLDPALVRRGRMDMHVELSYCGFQGFKVLAHNYLGINSHPLFEKIKELMAAVSVTPADVAESLMPKHLGAEDATEACLQNLITALERAKEEASIAKARQVIEESRTLSI